MTMMVTLHTEELDFGVDGEDILGFENGVIPKMMVTLRTLLMRRALTSI